MSSRPRKSKSPYGEEDPYTEYWMEKERREREERTKKRQEAVDAHRVEFSPEQLSTSPPCVSQPSLRRKKQLPALVKSKVVATPVKIHPIQAQTMTRKSCSSSSYDFPSPLPSPSPMRILPPAIPEYTFLVFGMAGVGKKSFLRTWMGKQPERTYLPSEKVQRVTMDYHQSKIHLFSVPGQEFMYAEKYIQEYPKEIHGIIVMYDMNSLKSMKQAIALYEKLRKTYPCVLVANKVDVFSDRLNFHKEIVYMSTKNQYNVFEPIQMLFRQKK